MRYILSVVLLLICSIGFAGDWHYVHYENGFYTRSNGFKNDGWWWKKDHCGRWYKHSKIPEAYPDIDSATFERDMLKFLDRRETRATRMALLEKFGVPTGGGQYANLGGQVYSGTSYVRQGIFPGGSTVQALGARAGYPVIDPTPLIQEQQRLAERFQGLSMQSFAGTNALVSQYTDAAKIQAAADSYAKGFAAVVQGAQQNREEFHQYQSVPAEQPQGQVQAQGSQASELGQMLNMIGDALHFQDCAKCHGPGKQAGDLTTPKEGQEFLDFKAEVARRLRLPQSDPQHMPKGGRQYTEEEINAYLYSMGS